jgi:transposase
MEELLRARLIPQGIARRLRAVLLLAEGSSLRQTRQHPGLNLRHIVKWRERFAAQGIEGLVDQPRSGRPRRIGLALQERIIPRKRGAPTARGKESLEQPSDGSSSRSELR